MLGGGGEVEEDEAPCHHLHSVATWQLRATSQTWIVQLKRQVPASLPMRGVDFFHLAHF
jgi:hypothetical protein